MGEVSEIGWTDGTFNPWWGCERVSPACAHCYADSFSQRLGEGNLWKRKGDEVEHAFRFFGDAHWNEPLRWNRKARKEGKPKLVFCASMADVFEDRRELLASRLRLWALIESTPWLTWQLLTKRPENVNRMVPDVWLPGFPENVWVGTSIENQRYAARADDLRLIPAFRFLSCEPLLGSLFTGKPNLPSLDLTGIGWVIGGGESGTRFRPTKVEWGLELQAVCAAERIPFFWKQNGGVRPKSNGKLLGGREFCEVPSLYAEVSPPRHVPASPKLGKLQPGR